MPRNGLPNEQIAAALRRAEKGAALDEVGRNGVHSCLLFPALHQAQPAERAEHQSVAKPL